MRKYLFILLLSLCASGLSAQSYRSRMTTAIDMGTYSDFFTYTDTRNTADYTNGYTHRFYDPATGGYYTQPPARDVFYKLTITNKSMQLNINDYGSSFVYGTRIYILDAAGNELAYGKPSDLSYNTFIYSLQPGTYYIVTEAATEAGALQDGGVIAIGIEAVAKPIADDFFYPAVLGTFHADFNTTHTINDHTANSYIEDYICDFKDGSAVDDYAYRRDLVHQFTITKPMDITLDNIGSARIESMHPSYMRILSSSMDTIREESIENINFTKKIHYELAPGTYYVYSKFTMDTYTDALYVLNITGKEQLPGSSASNPINAGSKSANFTYSHTQNTGLFSKIRLNEKPGKEVYYKFELTVPMEITVDNCGSAVTDTYLQILSGDQYQLFANDTYTGTEACANTQHAYIKVPVLLPGTYYVVSDGSEDGNITTTIKGTTIGPMGDKLTTAIDAGTHDVGFHFTDTKNTASVFTDQFPGKPTNDVFYKFKLTHPMDIVLSHCGSDVTDTYMSLLDVNGAVIYANDNYTGEGKCSSTGNALIKVEQMPVGTYYVVSEGNTQNGNITTTIEARSSSGNINTTPGQPHIIAFVPTVETDSLETLNANQLQRNVQYFDHYGDPTVNIALNAAPFGGDLVTLQETDGFFRKSKAWLPIAKTTDGGQYPSPVQIQTEARTTSLYGSDQRPYSQTIYDKSPLSLVVEQYGPGNKWFNNSRSVKTDQIGNIGVSGVLSCARYAVSGNYAAPTLIKTGFYADNELYVTRTTNEDNYVGYEFKDKTGHVILSRRMNGAVPHDTYYVYNDHGNLSFVLPPLASDALTATNTAWDESATTVKNYVYVYKYDAYNRCVFKKLPGCEPIYSIYDKADRLIYTQDGEHRAKPTPEWIFSIPDAFGRAVLTGKCTNSLNYQANPLEDILVKADYTGGTNAFKGYTVSGVSLVGPVILSVNYYDNYTFQNSNGISGTDYKDYGQGNLNLDAYHEVYVETTGSITLQPGFHVPAGSNFHAVISGNPVAGLPEGGFGTPYPNAKGQLTGTLTAQLEPGGTVSSEYLYSVKYYDNRGRIVQVAEKVTGGTNRLSYKNDFSGNPLFILESQSVYDQQTDILSAFTYDPAGRRLSEKVTINGTEQASVAYTYDAVGRLAGQKYAKGTWSTSETMDYNVRSWQTKKTGSYFSMGLRYNDIQSPNSTKLYGGGISEWTWQHSGGPENMYSLQYDDAERLTGAQQYMANGLNWDSTTDHYTENGISYDKNGNILTMQRSAGGNMIDNLAYTYDGNRLSALNESVASAGAADILIQGGSAQGTYNYNANGNMMYDSRKNLTYGYNFLNLTDMVKQGQTVKAMYKWSANGTKLSVRDGAGTGGFDYAGSVVYAKNGSGMNVEAINFDHGVIRKQADGYMVNYFLNDHLGSTRVIVDGNGSVLEKNDYYPFGARHKRNDYLASDNRYKYNGKEEQVVGDVGFLDYGARMYDPVIGRFNVIDRFAEKYYTMTPYQYGGNNPISTIDINGDSLWVTRRTGFLGLGGKETLRYEDGNYYNKDGSAYEGKVNGFLKQTSSALSDLSRTEEGSSLVSSLVGSDKNFTIVRGTNGFDASNVIAAGANLTEYQTATGNMRGSTGSGGIISFDPNSVTSSMNTAGNTDRPSFIGLGHEMAHARDANFGVLHFSNDYTSIMGGTYQSQYLELKKSEWRAVYYENLIRGQAGVPLRTHYGLSNDVNTGVNEGLGPRLLDINNRPINYYK